MLKNHSKPNQSSLKVCLLGASLDTGNMGVSALAASLINLILKLRPESNIYLLIGNRKKNPQKLVHQKRKIEIPVINYRLSLRSSIQDHIFFILILALLYRFIPLKSLRRKIVDMNPWLKTLASADIIGDIRGGDSFSNIYGLKRFLLGTIPDIITILLKKRLILLPQTYGPYNGKIARIVAKYIIKNAFRLYSRDRHSPTYLRNIFPNLKLPLDYCPDVAFTLEASELKYFETAKPFQKTSKPLIGINVNGLMYKGGYTGKNMFHLKFEYKDFIIRIIKTLQEETDADMLLIPHTFGPSGTVDSDPDACHEIYELLSPDLSERINMVTRKYNQNDIKAIIGICDFFIGSRMHSCIAALSQAIPTVGVAYSKKFTGVFNSLDFDEYVVDARNLEFNTAIDKTLACFRNREDVLSDLNNKVTEIKAHIYNTFDSILNAD